MEATAIQSATAVNATIVALANIQPNSFNPRRAFNDVSLGELADSIRQQGVMQPIALRHIADTDRYEIIYGERRYRASLIADKETIPAVVYDVDEAEAEEMSIAENLQRENITPTEEANAFQRLIDTGRHDVQSLSVQFGKSVTYIRTRLKFATLIPEIARMLDADEITVSVAAEICRYSEDVQCEVYKSHFENVNYGTWRGLKASELARGLRTNTPQAYAVTSLTNPLAPYVPTTHATSFYLPRRETRGIVPTANALPRSTTTIWLEPLLTLSGRTPQPYLFRTSTTRTRQWQGVLPKWDMKSLKSTALHILIL